MSSAVFCLPRLKRRLARARSGDSPIAVRTCDGSIAPDEHAAPVETDKPLRSSAITIASPSRQSKTIFVVLGTRGAPALLTLTWSTLSTTVRSKRSRSARHPLDASVCEPVARNLRRLAQPNDSGKILGSSPPRTLMASAVEHRLKQRSLADVQRTCSLRPVHLVRRQGQQVAADFLYVDRRPCPPPALRRCGSTHPLPRQSSRSRSRTAARRSHCWRR